MALLVFHRDYFGGLPDLGNGVGRRAGRRRQSAGTVWHGQPAGRGVPPHPLHTGALP